MKSERNITRRNFILGGLATAPLARLGSQHRPCVVTEDNILGPFYRIGSPWRTTLFSHPQPVSRKLIVSGRVIDAEDCSPLVGAVLDVWQADESGNYYEPPNYNLRGKMQTDRNGYFRLLTIVPGNYQDHTSKVESAWMRSKHIHFIVEHPGYQALITQCYFQNDEYLASDRYVKRSQIVEPARSASNSARFQATFNIGLLRAEGIPKLMRK